MGMDEVVFLPARGNPFFFGRTAQGCAQYFLWRRGGYEVVEVLSRGELLQLSVTR